MTEPKPWWAGVDWVRTIQRGATLIRALRADEDLAGDTTREIDRASKVRSTVDKLGRSLVGCVAPAACDCPICRDQSGAKR